MEEMNKNLESQIKKILSNRNFFDMVIEAKKFEPEYKKTEFYKETHMPLIEAIKDAKVFYSLQLETVFDLIQEKINNLNLENITNIMEQLSTSLEGERNQFESVLKDFKDTLSGNEK